MNRKPFLKSLSEGRGNCPLPSRTHPQKQTLVVYTEELTHLKSQFELRPVTTNVTARVGVLAPDVPLIVMVYFPDGLFSGESLLPATR